MKNKPFSLRLSDAVSAFISSHSKKNNKPASEIVRDAVEFTYRNDIKAREQFMQLMKDPMLTIANISSKVHANKNIAPNQIKNLFSHSEIYFFCHYIHSSYMHTRSNELLNFHYMDIILDITFELLTILHEQKPSDHISLRYHLNIFDLLDTPDWKKSVNDIKIKFHESPTSAYAEYITRPIEVLSDNFHLIDELSLNKIFTNDRIENLLPLLTYGLRISSNEKKYLPSHGNELLYNSFPKPVTLIDDDFTMTLYSNNKLYLLVTTSNSHYVFGIDAVFDFLTFAERFNKNTAQSIQGRSVSFLLGRDTVDIYDNEACSYRFFCHISKLEELCSKLKKLSADPRWEFVFSHYKHEQGDI